MRKYKIHFLIALAAASMIGLMVIQAMWIRTALEENRNKFEIHVNAALQRVAERLEKRTIYEYVEKKWVFTEIHLPKKADQARLEMLQGIAIDLSRQGQEIDERLDYAKLEEYLQQEFENRDLQLNFETAIINDAKDSFLYLSSEATQANLARSEFRAALFPTDIFADQSTMLVVSFPDQQIYLLKRVLWMLLFSGLFILIIVYSFFWMVNNLLRQEKLSAMKTDFINNMTHELKTPISTISLATQALRDSELDRTQELLDRFTGIISSETKRLESQVERVLQIAKMEKGQVTMEKDWFDAREAITDVVESMQMLVEEKGGEMHYKPLTEPLSICADRMHFINVLGNLLDNAMKYTESKPVITVSAEPVNSGLQISVADNGIGMSQEQQRRVFEKFYRIPTGNLHNVKGFGLGLSYVKSIVDAHGGHVSLKSSPGKGSAFTLWFPLKHEH
ncbi:MAG: HAMP domain-containing sensor histidine kinase [Bacteroidia bacterium]